MQRWEVHDNPEQLTTAKLKTELKKRGIAFPQRALKAEYVEIYKDQVLNFEPVQTRSFTSRAKDPEPRVRVEKLNLPIRMTLGGIDVRSLTDEELRSELKQRGFDVGPIGQTTRVLYQSKLESFLQNGAGGEGGKPGRADYSSEDSYEDDEDDDVEVEEEPVPVDTRSQKLSLLRSAEKGDSATRRRGLRSQVLERRQEVEVESELPESSPMPPSEQKQQLRLKSERRWVPVWMQILIVLLLAVFAYFVAKSMESNPRKMIPKQ